MTELGRMIADAGYTGISDFVRRSGVQCSFETVRRAVVEDRATTWSRFLILRALGAPKNTIVEHLRKHGDNVLAPMLDPEVPTLAKHEEAIISILRKLEPDVLRQYLTVTADFFKMFVALGLAINIDEETKALSVGPHKGSNGKQYYIARNAKSVER